MVFCVCARLLDASQPYLLYSQMAGFVWMSDANICIENCLLIMVSGLNQFLCSHRRQAKGEHTRAARTTASTLLLVCRCGCCCCCSCTSRPLCCSHQVNGARAVWITLTSGQMRMGRAASSPATIINQFIVTIICGACTTDQQQSTNNTEWLTQKSSSTELLFALQDTEIVHVKL